MRLKLFLKNFVSYGFIGVISQMLPMLVLPILTRLLSAEEIGINDLFVTLVSIGTQIVIFGMYDAVFRISFDRDGVEYRYKVCSTALMFNLFIYFVVGMFFFFGKNIIAQKIFSNSENIYIVYLIILTIGINVGNNIFFLPTKMENNRKIYGFFSLLTPIISYLVVFVCISKKQSIWALPLGMFISTFISCTISFIMNRNYFKYKNVDMKLLPELLAIAIPSMPSLLVYWIFNSADRIMIGQCLGNEAVGIYAIGAKLGLIANFVYIAFQGGWQFFVFSTMNDDDQVELITGIYESLWGVVSVLIIGVFIVVKPLVPVVFGSEFTTSYIVAPYLFAAPLFLMLYQTIANQFVVIKKTWISMLILISGAISNLLFNAFLIPILGIEGAALGTVMGYGVSLFIANIILIKMKLLFFKKRILTSISLILLFAGVWRWGGYDKFELLIALGIVCCVLYLYLFRKEIKNLFMMIKNEKY